MGYKKRVQSQIRRSDKARDRAQRKGDEILAGILKELNKADPGLVLRPTERDEVISFVNGAEQIVLNLETGELEPVCVPSDVGKQALRILRDQVGRKMDRWLKVAMDFQSKRVVLLEKAREIEREMERSAAGVG